MKKRLSFILALVLAVTAVLSSCSSSSGVEAIAWEKYDSLISAVRSESDAAKREAYMHIAEDWLMGTECIAPIYHISDRYLMKSSLTGVVSTEFGVKYFRKAKNGERTDAKLVYTEVPNSLDPAFAQNQAALSLVSDLFSGLYTYDENGKVTPELAESCTVSADGLTYTFKLREGLKWSNGNAFGASDFVYSWRRVADDEIKSPYAYLFDIFDVNEEGKLDLAADETDTVLTVTLKAPVTNFTELCAFPAFYPVNQNAVTYAKGYTDIFGNIINATAWTESASFPTSGAYCVSALTEGASYSLSLNKNYFGASEVALKTLSVTVKKSIDEAYALYTSGEIDYIDAVPAALSDATPSEERRSSSINGVYLLCHNFNSSLYSGMTAENAALLRRAISLYIDREYIVSTVTGNREDVATSLMSEKLPDGSGGLYRKNTGYHKYPFMRNLGYYSEETEENREEAREIIKALGLDEDGDGRIDSRYAFSMNYLTVKNKKDILIAQSVQQDLAGLGIVVEIEAVDERVLKNEQAFKQYDLISMSLIACASDPLCLLEHWVTDGEYNYADLGSVVVEENENAY